MSTPTAVTIWMLAIILTTAVAAVVAVQHPHPDPHSSRSRTIPTGWTDAFITVALAAAIAIPTTLLCQPTPTVWVA